MEITVGRSLRYWWVFILRGSLFILLSLYLFARPVSGILALSFLFGLIIFLAGIADLLRAYSDRDEGSRGWHLFTGILDLIIGVILMTHLGASLVIMRVVIGFYFIFRGVVLFSFRGHARHSWLIILGAIIVLLFVLLIWLNAAFGAMTIIIWTALAFLVIGIMNVALGIRLKR